MAKAKTKTSNGTAAHNGDYRIEMIPAGDITIDFGNAREDVARHLRGEDGGSSITQLAEDIKQNGLGSPIMVRQHPKDVGKFQVIAGFRRAAAMQRIRMARFPSIVRELSDEEALAWNLRENVQRENLSLFEIARAAANLKQKYRQTDATIAKSLGKADSYVGNLIRMYVNLKGKLAERFRAGTACPPQALLLRVCTGDEAYQDAAYEEWSKDPNNRRIGVKGASEAGPDDGAEKVKAPSKKRIAQAVERAKRLEKPGYAACLAWCLGEANLPESIREPEKAEKPKVAAKKTKEPSEASADE